ncbi:MAG TPA: serine/threonine-protein kinase [Solirubrobacterales bacterium]|nr:serine/threonine-protein kinase [Solirubrobacterales bacterium]
MSAEGGTSAFGPGAVLGDRYRLERRIATGGMATVWLARDTQLDRDVAVKVLSDVLADNPSYTARFRREARVAARLSDPNLVRIFDYSGETERPYIVMEHIPGGTLADQIAADQAGEVDPDRLARELLGALAAIHAAGVVHRDVKPSNVLLDGAGRAHLTDFGIAQPEDATQLTGTGEVIGTLKYMAPEILAGRPATERSDLYALGVVLAECLAGGVAPQLEALIDRLTATDPQERPASATQALGLLETYEQRATTATIPLGAASGSSGSKVIEVNAKRVLAALAVLALAGILVAVALAGGGSDGTPSAGAGDKTAKPSPSPTTTSTSTSTSTATTTSTTEEAPPTTEAVPAPEEKPSKDEEKPPKDEKPPKHEKPPPGQEKKD